METPEVLTDNAVATIGNIEICGRVTKYGNEIRFEGGRFKIQKHIKNMTKTVCARLKRGVTCSIRSASTDLTWSTKDGSKLMSYGIKLWPNSYTRVMIILEAK